MELKEILAVLVGVVINLLFGLNEALGKPDYRFLIFFKQNWFPTMMNVICGLSFAYFSEETLLNIMFFSSAGQFYWKKLANIFSERLPTKIGYNG